MRREGNSIREIEKILQIPRSTASCWLKGIELTNYQKDILNKKWKDGLIKARIKAVEWHNKQKEIRINIAHEEADMVLEKININDKYILELALAMLYLGEGAKTQTTAMANSNYLVVKFFIKSLEKLFKLDGNLFGYELHLRSDQNEFEAIDYWSNKLNIDKGRFSFTKDKRTVKNTTYIEYKGVCVVNCGRVAVQRRLVHLAEEFSKIVSLDP